MAQDGMKLTVTASARIMKFAEGADPEKDEPFEVVEQQVVLTGEEARQVLEQNNVKIVDGGIVNAPN